MSETLAAPGGATPTRSSAAGAPVRGHEELPEAALFWRWAASATRPTLGWALAGLGVIFIIVGWFGISGEAIVAKQLPYLISGGVGGIALVGVGATLIGTERLRQDSGRLDRLEHMVAELREVLLARPDAPPVPDVLADLEEVSTRSNNMGNGRPESSRGNSRSGVRNDHLLALPRATTYHLPSCSMVRGRSEAARISAAAAHRRGLAPCRLCEPTPTA